MSNIIMKDEVGDILVSLAGTAQAAGSPEFVRGYVTAIQAVAVALDQGHRLGQKGEHDQGGLIRLVRST